MSDEQPNPSRRSVLVPIAFGAAAVGAGFALWPFIAALGPPADERARRVVFMLSDLQGAAPSLIQVGRRVVMIFRRTAEELALLRRAAPNAPNWHRSRKPEIAVLEAMCTRGDCIVRRFTPTEPELTCPCCGAHYDLAGRRQSGPAPTDLPVPPHDYIGETAIEFLEYEAT